MTAYRDEIEITHADHRVVAQEIRAAVDEAITRAASEHYLGHVSVASFRPLLPPYATGPQIGARVTALVRAGVLEWTGAITNSGNSRTRNALRPCRVYRLTRPIPD